MVSPSTRINWDTENTTGHHRHTSSLIVLHYRRFHSTARADSQAANERK
jgi:hypothetical protein